MKLKPFHDRVVLKREESADQTPGGLFIPESAKQKEKPQRGTVLAVGPLCQQAQVGGVVFFGKYAGVEMPTPGGPVTIVKEEDIFTAIVEGE